MKKFIALMLISSIAHAEFYGGNDLLKNMQSNDYIEKALALGYVGGVADSFTGSVLCIPPTVQLGQAQDVVQNYLLLHPENRHFSADSLVVRALKEIWSCKHRTSM